MNYKKFLSYGIVLIFCIAAMSSPIIQACEEQESETEDVDNSNDSCSYYLPQSDTILDRLLERYPLLNQIIEMIINLIFNWLSKLGYQSSI